jgi:hypothetical protein
MKYRLTPFHLFSGFLIFYGIYFFVVLDMATAGLGGLFPYILIFMSLVILGFDFLFQTLLKKKISLYVIELLIIIAIIIWYYIKFGFDVL